MTIRGIGSPGDAAQYVDPAQTICTTGGALALLILNAQQAQRDTDHDEIAAARNDCRHALEEEVSAMHHAADQVFWGAIAQGSLAIVGGAASAYGVVHSNGAVETALCEHDPIALQVALKPGLYETTGSAVSSLAPVAEKVVSGSDGQHSLADAKAASAESEEARWRLDDLKDQLQQSRQLTDKTTQWVESLVDKQDSSERAVLSSLA